LELVLSFLLKWPVYMAQLNLNTRMRETGSEAFMLWTVDPSEVDVVVVVTEDVVVVVTEGVAAVAVDVKVAVAINLQPLMVLIFRTPAVLLRGRSGKPWVMGATLFDSYVNVIRVLVADGDPPVAEEAEAITTLNVVSLQLRQMIQTRQRILPLPPVITMTVVDVMDAGLVEGPMVGAALDSLGR
jgi:hypothetical protein